MTLETPKSIATGRASVVPADDNEKAGLVSGLWNGEGECPDFAKPENYMRALEAATKVHGLIQLWLNWNAEGDAPMLAMQIPTLFGNGLVDLTPVKALAALYDKERSAEAA